MYALGQATLVGYISRFLSRQYGLELPNFPVSEPPSVKFGEYAIPLSFELAKKLRKPPRVIAQEIVDGVGLPPLFEKLEVAGAGFINARLDRVTAVNLMITRPSAPSDPETGALQGDGSIVSDDSGGDDLRKILVEHTSINPNKAAHIGHLRNAILGDTLVRLLRASGRDVDVQNYIDNTGVQVADVVVGFMHMQKKSKDEVAALIASDPQNFDRYCWDLYASISEWYGRDPANKTTRFEALHAIEAGNNETAEIAEMVSTAVLRRHLETMQRLEIIYDFLPRESEILHLHFWDGAFALLKEKGVVYFENEGKNKGCWVMKRARDPRRAPDDAATTDPVPAAAGPDEDAKILVRSNGTVTYVGKDIAYHLWKFGLLGRDFGYRKFYHYAAGEASDWYPQGHDCWISAETGEAEHPHFGDVFAIYNVIDSRQADPQNNVIEALRAMGYTSQAEHYTHFSYEMVALTPRCALELGYPISEEDKLRPFIEVSGRKGFGVKADDLIDKLLDSAGAEVRGRNPELSAPEHAEITHRIAVGALRYFMLKFTRNSVIAFDFKEALSFEGETGPYCQYAVVRAGNIFRKAGMTPEEALNLRGDWKPYLYGDSGDEIWNLWITAGKLPQVIEQSIRQSEPAYVAKYAFQLAQMFNNFYHRHHILHESDEERKKFLLVTAAAVRDVLIRALGVLGIHIPAVM